jgi:hypothetical protein
VFVLILKTPKKLLDLQKVNKPEILGCKWLLEAVKTRKILIRRFAASGGF